MTRRELMTTDKKIRHRGWKKEQYIYFNKNRDTFIDERDMEFVTFFEEPEFWEYYVEPKPKKQIKFYEYIVSSQIGDLRLIWSEREPSKVIHKHTGNVKTVEIEE